MSNYRFKMIKFKTFVTQQTKTSHDSEKFLITKTKNNITKFASYLRRNGLDELPQLFQVITFKMNLVGPRPLMLSDLELMKENNPEHYQLRNSIKEKPGITGMWQLFGVKENGAEDLINFDLQYERTASLHLDLKILLLTIQYIFASKTKAIK